MNLDPKNRLHSKKISAQGAYFLLLRNNLQSVFVQLLDRLIHFLLLGLLHRIPAPAVHIGKQVVLDLVLVLPQVHHSAPQLIMGAFAGGCVVHSRQVFLCVQGVGDDNLIVAHVRSISFAIKLGLSPA
jgi:hypothetical protein